MRVAAIDIGTNAIRFLAAEGDGQDGYRTVAESRVPVRLGHGVFSTGRIDPVAATEAINGLAGIARDLGELHVDRHRAVATSAVRESPNRRSFLRRVRDATGLRVELIPGAEEIRLVHQAVRRRMPLGDDTWILVELGGGSVEIAGVSAERVLWSETHAMGAVRLVELFARSGESTDRFMRLVEEYSATIRIGQRIAGSAARGLIATGGNIEALARLLRNGSGNGPCRLGLPALEKLTAELAALTPIERQRAYELRADRADVIVPAAIVYARLARLAGGSEIIVPGGGVREGIVFDLMEAPSLRQRSAERGEGEGALALGRKFLFDETHGRQVAMLAAALFDTLVTVHGMGERERRILVTAALLHDVGGFVSYKSHHKHSHYLIARAELAGFTTRDMHVIATVARYHRKSVPSPLHPEYAQLRSVDRTCVRRCAALLRIADALDKEHSQKIKGLDVSVVGSVVHLRAIGARDVLLEKWALKKKDDLFREVYGLEISLDGDGKGADG